MKKKPRVKLICSPRGIDDIEKAIAILKTRGKSSGEKALAINKRGDITIYYDNSKDEMIEEELDI